jgi:ABC transporter with metal-binding/Fe-S-binding domain ATP-binding protein
MRLAVLFSGGKDSTFACYKKIKEVVCLITLVSKNPESYMFHTPNIKLTKVQAEAIGLPLISLETEGKKEDELKDLRKAIEIAKEKYRIDGIVTGAVQSIYQSERIKKICNDLDLNCVNPLWSKNSEQYWRELLDKKFEIIITSVSTEGLDKEWLGKKIDEKNFEKLKKLSEEFKFHLTFEGGEAETFVTDCPIFKKRIEILKASKSYRNFNGIYKIEKFRLVEK